MSNVKPSPPKNNKCEKKAVKNVLYIATSHQNYLELRRMQATPPLDPLQIMRAATLTALFSGRDTPLGKGVLEGLSALAAR